MPDYETKDVHTASGGTFETKNAPGCRPAAPVNVDRSNETPAPVSEPPVSEPVEDAGAAARKPAATKKSG